MSASDLDWAGEADNQERALLSRVDKLSVAQQAKNDVVSVLNKNNINENTSNEEETALDSAQRSLLQKVMRQGLIDNTNELEVQRSNPDSPLHSAKSFEELNLKPELLKGVFGMGFNAPSKIQETALPILLADPPQNLIAQSQSGTGKTAAFVLAMLSRVDTSKNYPQAICLSPTFELALQTGEVASKMSSFAPDITIRYAVRGENIERGSKMTEHILFGTPGKMVDWGVKFKFFDLSKVKVFVLDEADVMIDQAGHQTQSIRVQKMLSNDCQLMLFSATYDDDVMNFAESVITNPIVMRLKRQEESLDSIKQYWVDTKTPEAKYKAIYNIYGALTIGQAIIFCQTRKSASWLKDKITKMGQSVSLLTGELTIEERVGVLDRFRDGLDRVLITTNVMSRGIDIEMVTLVVNYDLPVDHTTGNADCETYLHRIGRTGRFGRAGIAINLIDGQRSKDIMLDIERHFGRSILKLDTDNFEELDQLQN